MFKSLFLAIFVVAGSTLSSTKTISGTVFDSSALLEISLVKVNIKGPGLIDSVFTDSLGRFSFNVPVSVGNILENKALKKYNVWQNNEVLYWEGLNSKISVEITNAAGRIVKSFSDKGIKGSFSLKDIASGSYFIMFKSAEGEMFFKYLNFHNSVSLTGLLESSTVPSKLTKALVDNYVLNFKKISYQDKDTVLSVVPDSTLDIKIVPIPNTFYRLEGMNFSPYKGKQNPNNNVYIPRHQIIERMSIIRPYTKSIRIFSVLNGLGASAEIAHKYGLTTYVGVWIGRDAAVNAQGMDTLIAMALRGEVDTAIIGSEALLRGDITPIKLIEMINTFKAAVPMVPVTTADVYGKLIENPAVLEVCDFIYGNFYPYWEGVDVKYGVASLDASYEDLLDTSKGKSVLISEAGWPSEGQTFGMSIPSPENTAFYFLNLISWSRARNVKVHYFEALDEPWKTSEGLVGPHWGIFDTAGIMKPGMEKVFAGDTMANNWTGSLLIDGEGTPTITTVVVPPLGSTINLQGKVSHVIPKDYGIVVYIKVGSGWWIKPTYASPVTKINVDGSWITDVTTGGYDTQATHFHIFLIPNSYKPSSSYSSFDQSKKVAELLVNRL